MAKKNDWVQIHRVALEPADRSASLPEDTKNVPLEVWVKGYLLHDAETGEEAEIEGERQACCGQSDIYPQFRGLYSGTCRHR